MRIARPTYIVNTEVHSRARMPLLQLYGHTLVPAPGRIKCCLSCSKDACDNEIPHGNGNPTEIPSE